MSYRQMVEGIADVAIFMLTVEGTVASWNLAAERIKGYIAAEIVGQHFSRFYTDADNASGEPGRAIAIARATGRYKGEGWRVRKGGSRFWASVVIDALHDDDGKFMGFAKITTDITDRSTKEEHRRVIVDAAPNAMLVIDDTGTIALANAAAECLFRHHAGALVGLSIQRLLSGDAINRTPFPAASRAPDNGSNQWAIGAAENAIGCRSDGSLFAAELSFSATPSAHGTVIVACVADITQRRAAGTQLLKSEASLARANCLMTMAEEMAHYGHWHIDLSSGSVYWSPEVCRIHGVPIAFAPTLEAGIAAYDPEGPDIAAIVRQAAIDGKPFSYESRILRQDNTFRDVRCNGRGDFTDGVLVALVGIFQDITEQKDAQRARDLLTQRVLLATQTGKVGTWECDLVSSRLTWDDAMFELYGVNAAKTVPSYGLWTQLLSSEDRARVVAEFEDALSGVKVFDSLFRVEWPSGELHSIRAQATVLRDVANEPVRMVGINWDITDIRNLADQMHDQRALLETAERARLYEHERRWSTRFQRAVLPSALPQVRGCTFDAVYEPGFGDAQVGGDWYDAVQLADGQILVSIGDVAGSGLDAAVVVGVARQIIRGISQLHADPLLILDAADRALSLEYPDVYVSAWVGLIDLVARTITYASAGHPAPLLVSSDGSVRELEDATTMLIGMRKGHRGAASTTGLTQGDALVLYTDGITEASRDLIAGTQALIAAARTFARASAGNAAAAITRHVIPKGSADDVALLVVRFDLDEAERLIQRWRFDVRDASAAARARTEFIGSLEANGFSPHACADAELVFGELLGNVVRHAGGVDVEVAVHHGGTDTVLHVMDGGSGFKHTSRLPQDLYAENGRGLFLISALTDDFTVSERPGGGSHARAVLVRGPAKRQ